MVENGTFDGIPSELLDSLLELNKNGFYIIKGIGNTMNVFSVYKRPYNTIGVRELMYPYYWQYFVSHDNFDGFYDWLKESGRTYSTEYLRKLKETMRIRNIVDEKGRLNAHVHHRVGGYTILGAMNPENLGWFLLMEYNSKAREEKTKIVYAIPELGIVGYYDMDNDVANSYTCEFGSDSNTSIMEILEQLPERCGIIPIIGRAWGKLDNKAVPSININIVYEGRDTDAYVLGIQ